MIERRTEALTFAFDPATLAGEVRCLRSGFAWRIDLTAAPGIAAGPPEPMWVEKPWNQICRAKERLRALRPQDVKCHRATERGVELRCEADGAAFALCWELGALPSELCFELRPDPSGATELVAAELPGALLPAGGSGIQVLTHQLNQGKLYTGAPGPLRPGRPPEAPLHIHDGHHRLRFFGVLGGTSTPGAAKAGYVAILEENADAEIVLRRRPDGTLYVSPGWLPCMGTVGYPRRVRYRFEQAADITSLAKAFRSYAQANGLFKSLKEKMDERPRLKELVGATACYLGHFTAGHDFVETFKRLKAMGHERFFAYPLVHINNRIAMTEENKPLHQPEIFEALRKLDVLPAGWVYLAGLSRGVKLDRLAARGAAGEMYQNWKVADDPWWQGCPKRVYEDLLNREEEVRVADGHHYDTTTSNALMECYAPTHPADRRDDRAHRIKLLQETTRHGLVASSEGVKDWAVPHYDIGSNKNAAFPSESPAWREVPVQNMVYHDALFFLWWEGDGYNCPHHRGGKAALQALTDTLYGDMPLLMPAGRSYYFSAGTGSEAVYFDHDLVQPETRAAAERAVAVARHFKRVATVEMTRFEFLSADGTVQRTEFGNGVSVIANFGKEPFTAPGGATVAPMGHVVL
ncbi:MAG: hypothetical protein L6R28_11410 [Planctomycetes bacterium]|nr:hypothetical protein [Planctomycetota bacterium]